MPDPVAQPSSAPTNKAVAATAGSAFGGAVAVLIVAGIRHWLGDPGQEVQAAIGTIVTTLFTLAAAYYTPPGIGEVVIRTPEGGVKAGILAPPPPQPG